MASRGHQHNDDRQGSNRPSDPDGGFGEVEKGANEIQEEIAASRKPATRRAGSGGPGAPEHE